MQPAIALMHDPEQRTRDTIGRNIRLMLAERHMTHRQLANVIGAYPSQVSNWCRGRVRPSAAHLDAIALALGQRVGWFYDDHDDTGQEGVA